MVGVPDPLVVIITRFADHMYKSKIAHFGEQGGQDRRGLVSGFGGVEPLTVYLICLPLSDMRVALYWDLNCTELAK